MSPLNGQSPVKEKTIKGPFSLSGIGIHSGDNCEISFRPADSGMGIFFIYQGKKIPALADKVTHTSRGTALQGIHVVEHVLAAAAGLGISNLEIELTSPEPPVLDGSALPYVAALKKVGIIEQDKEARFLRINETIEVSAGSASLKVAPFNGFKINFMIDFPYIGREDFRFSDNFESEIAPARTFGLTEELEALKKQGLARGATIENSLAISEKGFVNSPRFKDEPVRHKILDLIGDLALVGRPILGEFTAVKSGHKLNTELARRLLALC